MAQSIEAAKEDRSQMKVLIATLNNNIEKQNSKLDENTKLSLKIANQMAFKDKTIKKSQSPQSDTSKTEEGNSEQSEPKGTIIKHLYD